jgi:translation initiation factor 3 subunit D
MAPISLLDIVSSLPSDSAWGPPTTAETLVNGVPYAPYSKGDKLGRMADWTAEGKDREGRGRQQFNRAYRGEF